MRDGRIVSDIQVADRSVAEIEMQKLQTAEAEAKLTD
jgi:hypothetical protein